MFHIKFYRLKNRFFSSALDYSRMYLFIMVGCGSFEKCGRYDFWSTEPKPTLRVCGNIKEFNIRGILVGPVFGMVDVGSST
jgi:hypothetical protein